MVVVFFWGNLDVGRVLVDVWWNRIGCEKRVSGVWFGMRGRRSRESVLGGLLG